MGTAFWACDGLGVIPSVKGICVFCAAVFTHFEALHSGLFPVVGKEFDNRVAGSAIGAVDKRIVKPSVWFTHHFFVAVLTDRDIRRNKDKAFSLL